MSVVKVVLRTGDIHTYEGVDRINGTPYPYGHLVRGYSSDGRIVMSYYIKYVHHLEIDPPDVEKGQL